MLWNLEMLFDEWSRIEGASGGFCLLSWFLNNSCISTVTVGKSKSSIIQDALK